MPRKNTRLTARAALPAEPQMTTGCNCSGSFVSTTGRAGTYPRRNGAAAQAASAGTHYVCRQLRLPERSTRANRHQLPARRRTVRQPVQLMAEATVSMLLDRVNQPGAPPEKRLFAGQLIEGASARLGVLA